MAKPATYSAAKRLPFDTAKNTQETRLKDVRNSAKEAIQGRNGQTYLQLAINNTNEPKPAQQTIATGTGAPVVLPQFKTSNNKLFGSARAQLLAARTKQEHPNRRQSRFQTKSANRYWLNELGIGALLLLPYLILAQR